MAIKNSNSGKWQMMELHDGITTSNGSWYHINTAQIDKYVPELLKKIQLATIIKHADAWVFSVDALSLLMYFFLVFVAIDPLTACIIALVFYLIFYFNTSAVVNVQLSRLIQIFSNDGFLYGLSALFLIGISLNKSVLSSLSLDIEMSALWYGIAMVFVCKVGLLRLLLRYLTAKFSKNSVERQDRILNMLLIRYGLHHGILTKGVNEIQDELLRLKNYHKTRNKK